MESQQATVKARVKMDAVKIHQANSPDVLSGRVPLGFQEPIQCQEDQIVQLTYEQCVEMFGQERADELFRKEADGSP